MVLESDFNLLDIIRRFALRLLIDPANIEDVASKYLFNRFIRLAPRGFSSKSR